MQDVQLKVKDKLHDMFKKISKSSEKQISYTYDML